MDGVILAVPNAEEFPVMSTVACGEDKFWRMRERLTFAWLQSVCGWTFVNYKRPIAIEQKLVFRSPKFISLQNYNSIIMHFGSFIHQSFHSFMMLSIKIKAHTPWQSKQINKYPLPLINYITKLNSTIRHFCLFIH